MSEIRFLGKPLLWLLLASSQLWLLQLQAQQTQHSLSSLVELRSLEHLLLRDHAEYLVTDAEIALEQVRTMRFQPLRAEDLNQGISDAAFWIHLVLHNSSGNPRDWVLHNESTYLDYLNVYSRQLQNSAAEPVADFSLQRLSDRQPFASRPVDYRRLAFASSTLAGGSTELYLQLGYEKADAVSLNFSLWDADVFAVHAKRETLYLGGYFGGLLALLLVSLVLTAALRQRSYLYYATFQFSTIFMWLLLNGIGYQYLWPDNVFLHNEGFHIAFLLFTLTGFQFSKEFLQTRRLMPRVHLAISLWQVVLLLAMLLRIAGLYSLVLNISFLGLFSMSLLPVLGWQAWKRGVSQAHWYTVAWSVYAITLTLSAASAYTTLFNWGMDPLLFTQLGSLVESCLLLFAIGARILHLDRDRRQALELAHKDPLTGIGNRRLLVEHYESISSRVASGGMPVYVILIDMDHFKDINDRFGHDAGDKVLQELARLLQQFSREDDACIRYGGDEFLMVVRAKDLDAAYQIAERIRNHFADKPTMFNEQMIRHTLSVGVIPAITESVVLTAAEVLSCVDEALYAAKTGGRNQTVRVSESLSSR